VVHTVPFSSVDVIENMTKEYSQAVIDVGVGYRENYDEVVEVLKAIFEGLRADPEFGPKILEPMLVMGLNELADSAVIIRVRIKTEASQQWGMRREFNRRVKQRFDELGIEIPYPHRTVYFGEDRQGNAPPLRHREEPKE
jgi:small conductance mechanosensitive channel